jgi:tetratricopeptide (TPR) repeat protein
LAGALLVLVAFVLGGSPGQDREERIAALQRRSATVAPGTPEARAVAEEMGRIGSELLAEGAPGPALELLGEAYGLDEGNGRVLAELTLACVRAEDLEAARFYLERAGGGAEGAPPAVYRELGEEYFRLQRLEEAAMAWGEAARLSGQDPATLARLSRVRDELAVSRGQRSLSTEHFELFADPDVAETALRAAADGLETAYGGMTSALRTPLAGRQVVVLYSGRAYFSLVSVPDWVGGVYDGKIRVSVEPGSGDASASSAVLTHELAHAVLRQAAGERAPGWLHEGYAQWSSGRRLPLRELPAALAGGEASSAAALESSLHGPLDRRAARSVYAQTLSLLEHLVDRRGEAALLCVIAKLGAGASIEEALVEETGWSLEEFFASWKKWAGR